MNIAQNNKKRLASYYPGRRWRKLPLSTQPTVIEKVREALSRISPNDEVNRNKVGRALYHAGLEFSLWDDWSRNSPYYEPLEIEALWQSFRRTQTSFSGGLDVIFQLAGGNGHGR